MLLKAIECVHAGEAWLDRSTTASLLRELSPRNRAVKRDPEEMKISSISQREREVIQLVGKGLKNKQIAESIVHQRRYGASPFDFDIFQARSCGPA